NILRILTLPASLPRTTRRTPTAKRHSVRRSDARRHRRLAARPDPRGHGPLRSPPARALGARAALVRRARPRLGGAARRVVVPGRPPARSARARRPALPDVPSAGLAFRAARRYRSRPRRPAPPGDVQSVDAALQPPFRA